jgi:hypothetical protein
MANPRVFISSTWYDLRYIRENIKYFVKTLGYEPILSEEGSIFYDPKIHVQDACVSEIPNCQIFILIVGGRYGSTFKETQQSVTNAEYLEAVRLKIPVFALIEHSVYNDFHLYSANRKNKSVDATKIKYPSADSTKIFDFIETVRTNAINNALIPFRDFADIESYLRQQWAGMMFSAGGTLDIQKEWSGSSVGQGGSISTVRIKNDREGFVKLRKELLGFLREHGYTVDTYLADIKTTEV